MEIAFLTPVMPEVRAAIAACAHEGQRLHFADSEVRRERLVLVRATQMNVLTGPSPASAGAFP